MSPYLVSRATPTISIFVTGLPSADLDPDPAADRIAIGKQLRDERLVDDRHRRAH